MHLIQQKTFPLPLSYRSGSGKDTESFKPSAVSKNGHLDKRRKAQE